VRQARLQKLWDSLHSSYWFLPSLMALAAIALALTMLSLDRNTNGQLSGISWIYTGGPDGARAVLSAIAGSMMTVAGTAFSITIVALQLASSNFGPRLLRNFMQDTGNQFVLGTFLATFIYCILVLRTIYGEDYDLFVPQLSVTGGIVLAMVSIGVLIYFIHHASTIIQASHLILEVGHALDQAIERLFPQKIGHGYPEVEEAAALPVGVDGTAQPIQAVETGYLQSIDDDQLMKMACRHHLLVEVLVQPGEFVVAGTDLSKVYSLKPIKPSFLKRLRSAFILGRERTEQQDVEFPINQLVEISLRAMSPGINDPFTAIRCIDRLKAGLSQFVQRQIPSAYRYDDQHRLRVIAPPVSFQTLVEAAFTPIRQYSGSDLAVTVRLLDAITAIGKCTRNPTYHAILQQQAELILQSSQQALPLQHDRQQVQKYHQLATQVFRSSLVATGHLMTQRNITHP
jgi:uncharacterized membrane protein